MEVYVKLGDSKVIESEEVEKNIVFDYDENNLVVGVEMFLFNTLSDEEIEKMKAELVDIHSTIGDGLVNPLLSVAHDWKDLARERAIQR